MKEPEAEPQRFRHQAMATLFEVVIAGEDPEFAGQAALAVFQEIDRLEQELSRFLPNSDISRINNLPPCGRTRIGVDAFSCLELGKEYWIGTKGAFDVAAGFVMDCWKNRGSGMPDPPAGEIEKARRQSGMHLLEMDRERFIVGVGESVPCVDLGAVGKGYAVDQSIELLREWGVHAAIVHGGASSALGYDNRHPAIGWPVTLSDPGRPGTILRKLVLNGVALSGSGVSRGTHIVDPRTGFPALSRRAAWVCAGSAAASDAFSTACMVLDAGDIEVMCGAHPGLQALIIEQDAGTGDGRTLNFGVAGSGALV